MTTPRTRALWRTVKQLAVGATATAAGATLLVATAFYSPLLTIIALALIVVASIAWTLCDANLIEAGTEPYEAPYEDDDET